MIDADALHAAIRGFVQAVQAGIMVVVVAGIASLVWRLYH